MSVEIIQGDALAELQKMDAGSVRCCVTSPPYWGLRDYGTATWEGGKASCDHRLDTQHQKQGVTSQRAGRSNTEDRRNENFRLVCGKCGARRIDAQLGLEKTPEDYVEKLVAVFREVRRVLADDGTLWLNLGDSYASKWPCRRPERSEIGAGSLENGKREARPERMGQGLKDKDLVGVPWRVAFALQADGWWLRSDIIWSKPNPMPESVTDRPTKAHEYLFLLAKSKRYHYDADAIAEAAADLSRAGQNIGRWGNADKPSRAAAMGREESGNEASGAHWIMGTRRNRRTVWTIATEPFPGAHFAVFPQALVEPCILAGSEPNDLVLDPFCGSGTVGVVAQRHGRRAYLIDLNLDYVKMAGDRVFGPLFAEP